MRKLRLLFAFVVLLSVALPSQAQVIDFTASPRTGCGQLLTSFSYTITGNANPIVQADWDFGNGNGAGDTPGNIYLCDPSKPPCYTVTLRLTDAAGVVFTKTKTNYVCVYCKPTAAFAVAPGDSRVGCAPLTARLIDASVATPGNPIVAWQWSSQGGTPALVGYTGNTIPPPGIPNPQFTWTAQGSYAPALTVTDINGCKATVQTNGYITVTPTPVANFTSTIPTSCTEPHTVTFTNTTTTAGNPNVTYAWTVGANTFTGNVPPPQTFTAGTYDVQLIATGGACKDTITRPAYINVGGTFNFTFTPTSGCAGTTVDFIPPVGSTAWVWDFCDGQASTDEFASHTFLASNTPACCYPSLSCTLPGGCRTTVVSPTPICISATPTPTITADKTEFCSLPAVVNFSTVAPSNPNITCLWDMGDLPHTTHASCSNQTHTYTAADFVGGVVTAKLTWTDEYGCSGVATVAINYKPLVAAFTTSKVDGCVPYNTTLANTTAAPIFGSANSFKWYLDGALYSSTSAPVPAIYNYAAVTPCTHDFKLVVSNTLGCKDSITKTIKGGSKPTAVLSFSPSSVCAQFPIIFNVAASTAAPSPCPLDTKMYLDFGIGSSTTFTTSPISHIYSDTITHCRKKPYLIVYSGGCPSDTVRAGCVEVTPTVAKFGIVKTCTDRTLLTFDTQTLPNRSIGADLYSWAITPNTGVFETGSANGNAASSAVVGVRFVPGTYTVVLTTTNNASGCTQSTSKTFTVANPTAAFTMTNTQGCVDLPVLCTSTTNDAANVRTYAWSMNPAPVAPLTPPVFAPNPTSANVTATFSTPGAYTGMQLVVTDINGCTTTATQGGIEARGSAAGFTTAPIEGCVPITGVVFTDASVVFPAGAVITQHSWDLKNDHLAFAGAAVGSGSYYEYSGPTANTATYNFTAPGLYQMKHVIKTLVGGVTCTDSIVKLGFTGYAPVAYFTSPTVRCANQVLPIANTSAGTGTLTHVWSVNGVVEPLFTGATPVVSFPTDGVYVLCDEVTEATTLACKDSVCRTINVRTPVMDFAGTNLSTPCPPLTPSLVNTSQNLTDIRWEIWPELLDYTNNPPTFIRQYYLDPDNSSSIRAVKIESGGIFTPFDFALTEAGCYTVKLFGTNASGCRDSLVRNSYICISGPSATLTVAPTSGCASLPVTFNITDAKGQVDIAYGPGAGLGVVVHHTNAVSDALTYTYVQPGTYSPTVLLSDGLGCDITINSPTITVDSASGWTGYIKDNICIGDCAVIYASSASIGSTYLWQTNGTFDPLTATLQTITVCPLVTTTYTVTITDPNGCAKIASITVTVKNKSIPTVTIAPGAPSICYGTNILLFATGVQDGTTISNVSGYNWDTASPNLSQYAAIINPLASPTATTTYTVTVTGLLGCTATRTVEVIVIQQNIEMLGPDRTICKGGSVQLSIDPAAGVTNPHWSPAIAISALQQPTVTVNPIKTQVYYIEATSSIGCLVHDSVTVFVLQPGAVSAGVDKAICVGTPVNLSGSVPTGTMTGVGGTILWNALNGGVQPVPNNIIDPSVNPAVQTDYIMAYTIDQCIQEDTVTVFPLAAATIAGTGGSICRNATIQLNATGFSNFYTWTPSNTLSADNISNPIASPTETTTYNVVGSLGGNCATASAQITVNVNQLPGLSITPQNTTFFPNPNLKVKLVANTDPNNIIVWDPQIVEPSPLLDYYSGHTTVQFTPPNVGDKFQYLVTVTDANSCTNTSVVTLTKRTECDDSQIFVPTAFSPNGDGKNDVLYARGNGIATKSVLFRVFDRWGNLVFETNDIAKGWDGMYQGKFVNPDVYVYYLEAPCTLDAARTLFKKGNVTVIR